MKKILVVDDEASLRIGLRDNLEIEGYEVDEAGDGEQGLEKIRNANYNLVILDVMMPKMSGFDVCKKMRALGIETPVILLTAKGEEIDKVLGLELGADDYITKPFSLRELLARIKAILKRAGNSTQTSESVTIGKLLINFSTYTALDNGLEVSMSHREFEVIKYLLDHKNSTVTRENLLKDVWGHEQSITTRTIDNFILKLRQKIEADVNHPKVILTIYGLGYKLVL